MTLDAMRPLPLVPGDARPDSALRGGAVSAGVVVFALVAALAIHVIVPGALILASIVVELMTDAATEEAPPPVLEEEDVIEARFVMLGRDFLEELPNREVHVLSTAPPRPAEVPTEETPDAEEVETMEDRPPEAVERLLENLDSRIETFEEEAQRREMEGSAEGIEEGTEQEGSEGDIYRGRVMSFFRRGWSIPTTLAREEAQGLVATINVRIGPELQIVSFEIRNGSDNPVFDESVLQQLTRLQAADSRIPPPPEDIADQYIDTSIAVRFHGRDAS